MASPEAVFMDDTKPPSRLEAHLMARSATGSHLHGEQLDLLRLLLEGHIGTKEQRATVIRILKQIKPAKNYTQKLAVFFDDAEAINALGQQRNIVS